jgi:hypothetical protein
MLPVSWRLSVEMGGKQSFAATYFNGRFGLEAARKASAVSPESMDT